MEVDPLGAMLVFAHGEESMRLKIAVAAVFVPLAFLLLVAVAYS